MTKIKARELQSKDLPFFQELIDASPEWQEEECVSVELETYLLSYSMYKGQWRIWCDESDKNVGVSFMIEWSPSNEKPWIGTILIHPSKHHKGFGKMIIAHYKEVLSKKGYRVLFAGCPIQRNSWMQFLGKCGFEQFKVEKDEGTQKEYMISVLPL
ncbi:GNAT family N-acetyltransferase [Metabacillus niabensis]|uniref:GNAT family N-acetyltransferase n=1 Tax=Metabacillus niabensis TaxID=324854 RepID=UPI001CFBF656|nr:GNAT family N-acetyltransferase [Metabacillus niabensis]